VGIDPVSTDLVRRFDTIRVEDLQIKTMTRSAKGTRDNPGRNVRQKAFRCTACGFACHADVDAAINIAAGHPTHLPIPLHSRGGDGATRPVNREPHLLLQSA
jgi:transposase